MGSVAAYTDPALNRLHELLFAEDPTDFAAAAEGRLAALAAERPDTDKLRAIAADEAVEARLRRVAFHRLRKAGAASAELPLLGVVVEVALEAGLDTLAAYADGGVRYINHAGGVSVVEPGPLRAEVEAVLAAARPVVAAIGPWAGERPPVPPAGSARLGFLVGDEYYFGQGPTVALASDALAGPVLAAATSLLRAVVALNEGGN